MDICSNTLESQYLKQKQNNGPLGIVNHHPKILQKGTPKGNDLESKGKPSQGHKRKQKKRAIACKNSAIEYDRIIKYRSSFREVLWYQKYSAPQGPLTGSNVSLTVSAITLLFFMDPEKF